MTAETVSLRITLRYKDFDEFSDRFAENISSAGLFLRTRSPKPTGTKIRFELLLSSGDRILRGEGAVVSVRHDDRPGMALRFAALDQSSQEVVDRVVAQHGEGELAPTPLSTPFRRGSSVGAAGLGKSFGGGFGFGGASSAGFGSAGGVLPRAASSWAGRASEPPRGPSQPPPTAPSRRGSVARPWEALAREDSQTTQPIEVDEPATQRISVSPGPAQAESSQDVFLREEKTELSGATLSALESSTEALSAAPLPPSSPPAPMPASGGSGLPPELLVTAPDLDALVLPSSSDATAVDAAPTSLADAEPITAAIELARPAEVAQPLEPIEAASAPAEEALIEAAVVESEPTEAATIDSAPIEPTPVEEAPIEAAPAEVAPDEEAPIEAAAPVEAAPDEEAPIEAAAPVESEPIEAASVESALSEPTPAEEAPIEAAAVEPEPIEAASVESAPSEPTPAEEAPIEAAPAEAAPDEEAPIEAAAPVEAAPPQRAEHARPSLHEAPAPRPSWTSDLRVSDPPKETATADLVHRASGPGVETSADEVPLVVPVEADSSRVAPDDPVPSDGLLAAVPFEPRPPEGNAPTGDWSLDASLNVEEDVELMSQPPAPSPEPAPVALPPSPAGGRAPPEWASATPHVEYRALTRPLDARPRVASVVESVTPALPVPIEPLAAAEITPDLPPPVDFSATSDELRASAPAEARPPAALDVRPLGEREAVVPPASVTPKVAEQLEDFLGSFAPGEFSSPERTNPESQAEPGSWASEIASDVIKTAEPTLVQPEPTRTPPPRRGSGLVRSETVRVPSERPPSGVSVTPVAPPASTPVAPSVTPAVEAKARELIEAFVAEDPPLVAPVIDEATEVVNLDRVAATRHQRAGEREVSVRGVGPADGGRTPSQLDFAPPKIPTGVSSAGRRPAVEKEIAARPAKEVSIASGPEPATPDLAPIVPRRTSVPPAAGQWTDEPRRAELRGKPIVGLDLGGRWARLGMITDGRFEPLKLGGDERFFALVGLRDDGSVAVGAEARQLAAHQPQRVFSPRRILALVDGDTEPPSDLPEVVPTEDSVQLKLDGRTYDLAHILANLLEPLRSRIEAAVGANAARVIVSMPFAAGERAKKILRAACKKANLELVRLVTEPAAVLHSSDFEKKPVDSLLVVDLDAHDLTVSVARRGRAGFGVSLGVFEPALSATQLNEAIMRFVISELEKQGEDVRDDQVVRARLLDAIEKTLDSSAKEQNLELKVVLPSRDGGSELERAIQVPAQRLVEVTERWIGEIMAKVNQLLVDAGIHPRALGAVVLAGSAARYPALVRELIAQTQIRPQDDATGAHLRVRGLAAIAQRVLAEERVERPERLTKPIGLGLPGGRYRALVSHSDALPVRQVRKQATTRDFQSEVELMFYQGTAEQVGGNTFLGSVGLTGLPKEARGEIQVEVEILVDKDAVLTVTLSEETSGKKARLTVPTEDTPHPRAQEIKAQPTVVDLSDPTKAKQEKKGLIGRFFGR